MLQNKNSGYSLIELMITVGIIGILAGIAIPAYNDYLSATAGATGITNAETLMSFEENFHTEMDTYLAGNHPAGAATSLLTQNLHWQPNDKDRYSYDVKAGTTGDIKTSLEITVTCDICLAPIVVGN